MEQNTEPTTQQSNEQPQGQPETRTFTSADVERIVQDRVAKAKNAQADLAKQLEQARARAAELEELHQKAELANKPEAERKMAESQREAAKYRQQYEQVMAEREQLSKAAEAAQRERDSYIMETKVSDALARKGCMPSAIAAATDRMVRTGALELVRDEAGGVKLVARIGGMVFDDVAAAAEAFLKTEPWFAAMPQGGAGTSRPNGSGGGRNLDNLSPAELLKLGLAQTKH